jgi:peptide/nickel transport system permease protein
VTHRVVLGDPTLARAGQAPRGPATSRWARTWRRFKRQKIALGALFLVGLVALLALLAPVIAPFDPASISGDFMDGPTPTHLVGTDGTGRDLLSRMLFGARTSLVGSLLAVTVGFSGGTFIGLVSGYAGGVVDMVIMRCADALLSFPFLLTAMTVIGVLGTGEVQAMLGLAIAFTPAFGRVVRGQVLAVREEDYVAAARVIGASDSWIVRRHVFANVLPPLLIVLAQLMGGAIIAEGALAFLGISVQPPETSLGALMQDGFANINVTPRLVLLPGIAITLLATSFNAIADGFRDALAKHEAGQN